MITLLKDQMNAVNLELHIRDIKPFDNTSSCDNCSFKMKNYQLRADCGYWKKQHARALERLAALEKEKKESDARIRYLTQQLYGRKTEKKKSKPSEKDEKSAADKKNRGHQPGAPQHPRRNYDNLPETEEMHDLDEDKKICPCCGLPFEELPGTEDSTIIEVEVKAHKRKIRKKRYRRTCNCEGVPGIITAPVPPKLLHKTRIGISIRALIFIEKYHFQNPIYRVLKRLSVNGLSIPQGTIGDGLKRMKDIFNPIYDAIVERNLTGKWWQADETRWQVMEFAPGKLSYRWYLWVFITEETVVYIMDPTRATIVIKRHFGTIIEGILLVDRYSAYKSFAKNLTAFMLAFCWAHVRRDFLDAANEYPKLEAWAMEWKAAIGHLIHLNKMRIVHPIDSKKFKANDLVLKEAVAEFKVKAEEELQQPNLHFKCKAVLKSLENHWDGLTVFIDHPYIPMDNNGSERMMRNPCLGRKNYYGSGRIWSAHFSAKLFSIFQTLVKWDINLLDWLTDYLTACAQNKGIPPDNITAFLPWNMTKSMTGK